MKSKRPDPVVNEFSVRVREALGCKLLGVYWFGSRARGEGGPESDYDLLLETRARLSEQERDDVADVAVDMSADHGVLLDIHERTAAAMKRRRPFSVFVQSVLEEAVPL